MMGFLLQFAISYAVTLAVVTVVASNGLSDVWPIAVTYGIVAFPFGLAAAGLARLFERVIGWPGGVVAVLLLYGVLYLIAANKQNFWRGFDSRALSGVVFAAVWCFLSWHRVAS